LLETDQNLAVNFRTAAEKFQLIDDPDKAVVVVRYEEARDAINSCLATIVKNGPNRETMRKLQRFTVSIQQRDADQMLEEGGLELVLPGLYAQTAATMLYDSVLGLRLRTDLYDPGGNVF